MKVEVNIINHIANWMHIRNINESVKVTIKIIFKICEWDICVCKGNFVLNEARHIIKIRRFHDDI